MHDGVLYTDTQTHTRMHECACMHHSFLVNGKNF